MEEGWTFVMNVGIRQKKQTKSPDAEDRLSTKDKILDAAEELFAQRGYYGVSLREITRQAGVELALANYHFGPKEELFRQVIARRADEYCKGFTLHLEEAQRAAGLRALSVEAVIRAFCAPIFEKTLRGGPGWKRYIQLLSHTASSPQHYSFLKPMNERYDPVVKTFVEAFKQSLPAAPARSIYQSLYFLQGALVYLLAETGGIDRLSGGLCLSSDFDTLLEKMVPFFAAGFHSLAGTMPDTRSLP